MRTLALLAALSVAAVGATLLPGTQPGGATPLQGIAAISTDGGHACALTDGGGVKCWGNGEYGELGDGTNDDGDPAVGGNRRRFPVDVVGLGTGVAAVSAGFDHTCAVTVGGGVKCWGHNHVGQIGVQGVFCPDHFGGQFPCSNVPVDVPGLGEVITAIATGNGHTCALTVAGGAVCWGKNRLGQLGNGTTIGGSAPVEVCQVYDSIAERCTELLTGIAALAAGGETTCALIADGGVKCWGGVTGDGTNTRSSLPVDVTGLDRPVVAVDVGETHGCAVLESGRVRCWGSNFNGELGDGTANNSSAPVEVCEVYDRTDQRCRQPLLGIVGVATAEGHTCAVEEVGGVTCWGLNAFGDLGDGRLLRRGLFLEPDEKRMEKLSRQPPGPVAFLENAVSVKAREERTCALTAEGGVKCWGMAVGGACDALSCPVPADVVTELAGKARGDVNLDGRVTGFDALFILQSEAHLLEFSLPSSRNANADGDDDVDAADATLILQNIAGLLAVLEDLG